MSKKTIALLVIGLLGAHVVVRAQASTPGKSTIIERVLVRVNGEILTQTQLEQRQVDAVRDKNKQVESAKDLKDDATLRALVTELTPDILVDAVDELLQLQRGRELGFKFTDEQFKAGLDNVKKQNKLDDAGLREAMLQAGMTLDQLRVNFERTYIIQEMQRQEIRLNLTEEEARQYYTSHPNDFMKPATVTIREITVLVPATMQGGQPMVNVGLENAAKEKIDAIRARALKGEDFAVLAGEVSESASKASGGLIGQVNLEQLNPALKEILDKLKAGDVSEPIRTQGGFQMIKVDSKTAPERETFTKMRDEIGQRIYDDRLQGETKKLLGRLRTQALIEWKDQTFRQIYEKRMAEKATGG
jgi:peptidyl-prolyl cis-trans isomerase SurA